MDIKFWYNKAIKEQQERIKDIEEKQNGKPKVLRPGTDRCPECPRR